MATREGAVELVCTNDDLDCGVTVMVEGRYNAEGELDLFDQGERSCPECGCDMEPTDPEVRLA